MQVIRCALFCSVGVILASSNYMIKINSYCITYNSQRMTGMKQYVYNIYLCDDACQPYHIAVRECIYGCFAHTDSLCVHVGMHTGS